MKPHEALAFVVYSILFEAMVWGGWFWIVFVMDRSAWWTILAIALSSAQLKGHHFTGKRAEP